MHWQVVLVLQLYVCYIQGDRDVPLPSAVLTMGSISQDSTSPINDDPGQVPYQNATPAADPTSPNVAEPRFWEYRLSKYLLVYGGLIIAVTGILGNSLSIAVLVQNPPLSSTSMYLVNLAVADLGVNIIGQLLRTVPMMFQYDITALSPWVCKFWIYFNHSLSAISSWILVAVTIERTLVVYLPLNAKSICTRRASKVIIVVINILFGSMFVNFFWAYGWSYKMDVITGMQILKSTCTVIVTDPAYIYYMKFIRPWLNFVVLFAGPFVCLFICNILILWKLFEGKKTREHLTGTSAPSIKENTQMKSITLMLVTVSFTYLVCTSPLQILYLVDKVDPLASPVNTHEEALTYLRWACAVDLKFLNHAVNFILYCISGKHFRAALRKLIANCCKINTQPMSPYASCEQQIVDNIPALISNPGTSDFELQ